MDTHGTILASVGRGKGYPQFAQARWGYRNMTWTFEGIEYPLLVNPPLLVARRSAARTYDFIRLSFIDET